MEIAKLICSVMGWLTFGFVAAMAEVFYSMYKGDVNAFALFFAIAYFVWIMKIAFGYVFYSAVEDDWKSQK